MIALVLTCALVMPLQNTASVLSVGSLPHTDTPVLASAYRVEYTDGGDSVTYEPAQDGLVAELVEERTGAEPRMACELVGEGGLLWGIG